MPGNGLTLLYRDKRHETRVKKEVRRASTDSRFAFIVSTKTDKRATVRNRVKRLLSESVRNILQQIKRPVDGVVIAKREMVGKTQGEVENRITDVFKRSGIL